jgi:hypothetical protein
VTVVGVAILLVLLGFWPTRRLGGTPGVQAMFFAVGITVLGSVLGAVPVLFARLSGRLQLPVALASMLVRLVIVVVFATVTVLSLGLPMTPFLLWLAIAYLILLVVDTVYATRLSASL